MKRTITFALFLLIALLSATVTPQFTTLAQNPAVKCGDIVQGELTSAKQNLGYPIVLSPGDKITVSGQAANGSKAEFGIVLDSPAGIRAFPRNDGDVHVTATPFLATGRMSYYGIHTIYIFNNEKVGSFQIGIGCELADGTIIPAGDTSYTPPKTSRPQMVTLPISSIQGGALRQIQCGEVLTTAFSQTDEVHAFVLAMEPGDQSFTIKVTPFGDYLYTFIVAVDSTKEALVNSPPPTAKDPSVTMDVNPSGGNYSIYVANAQLGRDGNIYIPNERYYMGGVGIYSLLVSCVIKGGEIVSPDPAAIDQGSVVPTAQPSTTSTAAEPTGDAPAASTVCAGSPTSRLVSGGKGRVLPGDSNNLRTTPDGELAGQIPPGGEFDIVGGPSCGPNDRLYWQVTYEGVTGWTAEGEGITYWLEPVASGRG